MKKLLYLTITGLIFVGIFPLFLFAQLANLHGTDSEFKMGLMMEIISELHFGMMGHGEMD